LVIGKNHRDVQQASFPDADACVCPRGEYAVSTDNGLQGLRRFMLATQDAHCLYSRFGFAELANPDRLMEIHNPNAYATVI
jgi:hypothetical protein